MTKLPRIGIHWSENARADVRSIDREPALHLLYCLNRYCAERLGDVKRLQAPLTGFRLKCGEYRLFFDWVHDGEIEITAVLHRRNAYR